MDLREWFNSKAGREISLTKSVARSGTNWCGCWGENLSRRAFGKRGPDFNVTLTDLEQLLRPLAVASGFLAQSDQEQTEWLAETLLCPDCGRAFAGGTFANADHG